MIVVELHGIVTYVRNIDEESDSPCDGFNSAVENSLLVLRQLSYQMIY
jgi:hypothetical protein